MGAEQHRPRPRQALRRAGGQRHHPRRHRRPGSENDPLFQQTVQAEAGFAYGVIGADLHVFQDAGPVYTLIERAGPLAVDAAWLLEQPSRLLDARYEVVAFDGREAELADLTSWLEGPQLAARWLHGPGGQGKTRLVSAFAHLVAERGWKVVTAAHRAVPSPGSQDLHDCFCERYGLAVPDTVAPPRLASTAPDPTSC
ncbi:hypothetical protein GCM10009733_058370 [Nonomuraea maheshkhaliensis]|uniref:ATP-binding protein n=1 Tax=Nonomuraea maheshkhaliensis TaxID=419590 RepID=A0ABN2FM62_9ACTN